MHRSPVTSLKPVRLALALTLVAALALAVPAGAAACGEDGPEDTGPLVTAAKLTPVSLPSEGGTGVVTARVDDDCGIQQVYGEITGPEGIFASVQMLPYEIISGTAIVYRGEFQIPANFQEWSVSYYANVLATDTNGAFIEAFAGEVEVAGLPPFDEVPYVSEARVARDLWGGWGGSSPISASASDNRGLANVYAIVTNPDKSQTEVGMEPVSTSRFEGSLPVPANLSAAPKVYSVTVFAEDDIGQTTSEFAGTVTVEPKGIPNPGQLALEPANLYFGPVPLGQDGPGRSVRLANTGKPGSPPVSGFLRTSDPQFHLPGASEEGLPFTLAAGEERVLEVGFRPSVRDQQNGRLLLVRADGRQPKAGVNLFGWGLR